MRAINDGGLSNEAGTATWIALVTVASVVFSLGLACATPFAALATVAGLALPRWPAFALVAAAWLANQAVGYGILGYPTTPDSFGWGIAIGTAALAATAMVLSTRRLRLSPAPAWVVGFALAFLTYEGVLLTATTVLPSGTDAFSAGVVGWILVVNLLALGGLVVLYRIAVAARLFAPAPRPERA